jgi:hypothetical protein
MTAVKAVGRPFYIYKDKNTDEQTKKYAAISEFLYQVVCIGITVGMIPFFKAGGLKIAEKYMMKNPQAAKVVGDLSSVSLLNKVSEFGKKYKEIAKTFVDKQPQCEYGKAMAKANGAIETGSFVGSIIGLTLLAPPISHAVVHPIMNALGMHKKESENPALERLQQPILLQGHHKEEGKVDKTV